MKYHVLVDSRDRDFQKFAAPNSYRIRLPRTYRNVVGARLLSADIPSSFYVFSAAMGTTSMVVTVSGVPQTITIADGNYTTDTVIPELKAALLAAFPGKTFDVDVDERTMRLVVECLEGDAVGVDTTADAAGEPPHTDWGLAYYLGFPKGVVTTGTPLRSPGMVNLNPFTYILLDIQELGTVDEGGVYGSQVGKGCFCKIPVQGTSWEYIFRDIDTATDMVDSQPPVPRLETLTVTFRLHNGTVIDFRGVEHSFLVELVTRDPNPMMGVLGKQTFAASAATPPKKKKNRRRGPAPPAPPPPPPAPPPPPSKKGYVLGATVLGVSLFGIWWWSVKKNSV